MATKVSAPTVQSGAAPVSPANSGKTPSKVVAFRFGTLERNTQLSQQGPYWGTNGINAATQNIGGQIQGDGYLYSIRLQTVLSGGVQAGGTPVAAVPFEDAPYSLYDTIGLKDSRADLVSTMNGFSLFIGNLMQANYKASLLGLDTNTSVLGEALTGSAVSTQMDNNGNCTFFLEIPSGLNLKTLAAIVGNQDANSRYTMSLVLASGTGSTAGPVFTTAPSNGTAADFTAPAINITPGYRSFQVPPATIGGVPVQQLPPGYGKLHLLNSTQPQNSPANGGSISHYLSLNKVTIRSLGFIFRNYTTSGGVTNSVALRANTELAVPSTLRLFWGATETFEETWPMRRSIMAERFGAAIFPAGVVVYDGMSDMLPFAGVESGASYIDTSKLTSAKLQVNYPTTAGSWAAGSQLTVVQDALQVVTPS